MQLKEGSGLTVGFEVMGFSTIWNEAQLVRLLLITAVHTMLVGYSCDVISATIRESTQKKALRGLVEGVIIIITVVFESVRSIRN